LHPRRLADFDGGNLRNFVCVISTRFCWFKKVLGSDVRIEMIWRFVILAFLESY
jgi:hypothetical protein